MCEQADSCQYLNCESVESLRNKDFNSNARMAKLVSCDQKHPYLLAPDMCDWIWTTTPISWFRP